MITSTVRTIFRNSRRFVLAAACAALLVGANAWAGPSSQLAAGRTSVTLSADFANALGTLRVTADGVQPGRLRNGVASFPISGGVIDLANARGEIVHTGGLSLRAGTTTVQLLNFTIDTSGTQPVLTGAVVANGDFVGRLPLFNLQLPTLTLPIRPNNNRVTIPNVRVTLTAQAAAALNAAFGVTAFAANFNIGTATADVLAGVPQKTDRADGPRPTTIAGDESVEQ